MRSLPSPTAAAPARSTTFSPGSSCTTALASTIRNRRSRHDDTDQWYGLAKITGIIDDQTRVSFIAGGASSRFQIPNIPFKAANFTVFGNTDWNSGILDQRQWEQTYFGIASLQKSYDTLDFQLSGFARYSKLSYQ